MKINFRNFFEIPCFIMRGCFLHWSACMSPAECFTHRQPWLEWIFLSSFPPLLINLPFSSAFIIFLSHLSLSYIVHREWRTINFSCQWIKNSFVFFSLRLCINVANRKRSEECSLLLLTSPLALWMSSCILTFYLPFVIHSTYYFDLLTLNQSFVIKIHIHM